MVGNSKKHIIRKMRVFMFVYWAMMLSVTGMYTMYLGDIGFTKGEIGIAVTIYMVSALIGQNVFGYLADKTGNIKKVFTLSTATGILIATLLAFAKSSIQIYVLIFLWGFFICGTVPLSDVWCINSLKASNELNDYGKIRGFGSIGYGISGVLLGLTLQFFGWKAYYWYIAACVCLTLLAIFAIGDKEEKAGIKGTKDNKKASKEVSAIDALKEIIKIKPLVSMVILIFIYSFVVKGIYNYLGVLIGDYGGGPLNLGFTYFFDASPEIVTFFLTTRLLRRFHSKKLVFVAFLLQTLRLTFILIFNSALAVTLLGTLSGFAYGLLSSSYKTYLYELAPEKYKASCMSLCETTIGMSAVFSAPVFGFLFDKFGANFTITFGLVIYIISVIMLLWNFRMDRKANVMNTETALRQ